MQRYAEKKIPPFRWPPTSPETATLVVSHASSHKSVVHMHTLTLTQDNTQYA